MIDLNFSREFFAAMLVTEVEKVGFAVLIRTFPDAMELQHPAVLIRGIREFAFDIAEGCFVRLGARCDGKIEALRSGISKSGDEIRFTAVDYVYRESEFRKKYVVVSTGFFGVGRRLGCNSVRKPTSVGSRSAPGLPKNPSGRACCFRGSGGKAP